MMQNTEKTDTENRIANSKHRTLNREILRLAIPNILSNISVPLLSSVDTILMGRLSALHIGAVGIGSMLFNFLYWNFGFLRMGTTGITAQAYGRDDRQGITETLGRALLIGWTLAALILLLQMPLIQLGNLLMNVEGQQAAFVSEYFLIRVWAAPATLASYVLFGWFFGMQNALIPLVLTILVNVVNIGANILFVKYFHMEVSGVAWGTVIAQYAGLAGGFTFLFYRYRPYLQEPDLPALLKWFQLKRFLRINADIFIRTLCLTFAFGFFYSQSAQAGETLLAVNVILLQFLNWMSYGVDGFAFAAESLVGKYVGRDDAKRTMEAIRRSFWWGMGLAVLFSLTYWFGGISLLQLFTDQVPVITAALPFLAWMAVLPIVGTPCYIWDGVYVGLTASKSMRNSMLLALGIYLITFFLLRRLYPIHGLWLALLLFLAARGVIQWFLFERKKLSLD